MLIGLSGQIFGKLTVVSLVSRSSRSRPQVLWLCQCACGKQKIAQGGLLRRRAVQSCGKSRQIRDISECVVSGRVKFQRKDRGQSSKNIKVVPLDHRTDGRGQYDPPQSLLAASVHYHLRRSAYHTSS